MALNVPQPMRPAGAGQLPKSFIEDVRSRTDLERVVGRYVPLKKAGANLIGLCPFHGEKSPSFTVAPAKQFYHCFGCGKNGDAIAFLQEYAGLTFREAVLELAQEAGLRPPAADGPAVPQVDTASLYRTNEIAASFFRHCLQFEQRVKDYLTERKLPAAAQDRFLIGYAADEWQGLAEAFGDYSSNKHLFTTGLVIIKDDGRRYDRFRDRLMFGIRDARGRIVGFGGRTMGDAQGPKYLNSPESPIFDKGSSLFGVYEAREGIRQAKQVLVVEGYMDCCALSAAGLPQTVATMGTACTPNHIERLTALASEVVFAFDGDAAGLKAAWKSLLTCLPFATDERHFRFLLLPAGLDPDELVIAEGPDAFRERLRSALSLSAFLIQHLRESHGNLATAEDRAAFAKEATELTYQLPSGGRLGRILRQEILAAAGMQQRTMTTVSVAGTAPRPRGRGPWVALAAAVGKQPVTAAQAATAAIEALSTDLQEAFFNQQWSAFPGEQQPFWQGLMQAIVDEGAGRVQDLATPNAEIERDLLRGAARVIAAEQQRAERQNRTQAFRSGQLSEEEMLRAAMERSKPPRG